MSWIMINVTTGNMADGAEYDVNINAVSGADDPPREVTSKGRYLKFGILGWDSYTIRIGATAGWTTKYTLNLIKKDKKIDHALKSRFGDPDVFPSPTTFPPPTTGSRVLATLTNNGVPVSGKSWVTEAESGMTNSLGQVIVTAGVVDHLTINGNTIWWFDADESVIIDNSNAESGGA